MMTVYIAIIRVPEDNIKDYTYFEISSILMNFNTDGNIYSVDNSVAYGIYGWTTKKSIYKEFQRVRSKHIFHKIIRKMTKSEYKKFAERYADYELCNRNIGTCEIISTSFEEEISSDEIYEIMYTKMSSMDLPDLNIFNDGVLEALIDLACEYLYSALMGDPDALMYAENNVWKYDIFEAFVELFGNTFSERII